MVEYWQIRAPLNLSVVAKILKIIICPKTNKDKWIWTQDKNGSYSVKSDCWLFKDELEKNKGKSYNVNRQNLLKSKIEDENFSKDKVFAWRACQDGLTTLFNLRKMHVEVEDKCYFCEWARGPTTCFMFLLPSEILLRNIYLNLLLRLTSKWI